MFKNIKYSTYQPPKTELTKSHLESLEKLVQLCDQNWSIDRSASSTKLLGVGVVTIKNDLRIEHYQYFDLILYKLPPIIFSNNHYFLRAYQKSVCQVSEPLNMLVRMTVNYYAKMKKQTIQIKLVNE